MTNFIFLRSHQSFIFKISSEHFRHCWCNNSQLFLSNIQLLFFPLLKSFLRKIPYLLRRVAFGLLFFQLRFPITSIFILEETI